MASHRFYLAVALMFLGLFFFQYRLWSSEGGMFRFFELRQSIKKQQAENNTLHIENENLRQEVALLQKNQELIEGHARQDLGMIKKDEVFYQIVKDRT